ncbi:MAG: hypothetical protein IT458_02770 [Planctomycetes bacterium]|nr:hypothetical protein [Planctomycetota bacterium]
MAKTNPAPRARGAAPADAAVVEEVASTSGSLDSGIVFTTSLLLVIAIALTVMALQNYT